MAISKFNKLDKITLARWVDKALHQSLTKQNIKVGFRLHEYGLSTLNLWMKNQSQ